MICVGHERVNNHLLEVTQASCYEPVDMLLSLCAVQTIYKVVM